MPRRGGLASDEKGTKNPAGKRAAGIFSLAFPARKKAGVKPAFRRPDALPVQHAANRRERSQDKARADEQAERRRI